MSLREQIIQDLVQKEKVHFRLNNVELSYLNGEFTLFMSLGQMRDLAASLTESEQQLTPLVEEKIREALDEEDDIPADEG